MVLAGRSPDQRQHGKLAKYNMLMDFASCRTPSFRELKSRIEKPGEAESWGPIRRRARRGGRRPKFDWQHPFSSAVRWIAPDNSDSASMAASEDLGSSVQVGLSCMMCCHMPGDDLVC